MRRGITSVRCMCGHKRVSNKAGPDGGQPRDRWCACDPTPCYGVYWAPCPGYPYSEQRAIRVTRRAEELCDMVTNTYAQADESRTTFAVGPTPTLPNLLCKCGGIASCDQLEKPDIAGKRYQATAQRRIYEINTSSWRDRQHLIVSSNRLRGGRSAMFASDGTHSK